MRLIASLLLLALVLPGIAGCGTPPEVAVEPREPGPVASSAEEVEPLDVAERAPELVLEGSAGETVDLQQVYGEGPTVLVFYRGGWCPYCNTQLSDLAELEPDLLEAGYQILAVSPDRPAKLRESLEQESLSYRLVSDSDMRLSRAFGLAFRVDEATIEQYHEYDIDLEDASGRSHHLLPVPAVYLIDREGVIQFAFWDPDYRERLSGEKLLEAAEATAE